MSAADHFGFVAEQIGTVKIGSNAIPLANTTARQPIGPTGDFDVHKV